MLCNFEISRFLIFPVEFAMFRLRYLFPIQHVCRNINGMSCIKHICSYHLNSSACLPAFWLHVMLQLLRRRRWWLLPTVVHTRVVWYHIPTTTITLSNTHLRILHVGVWINLSSSCEHTRTSNDERMIAVSRLRSEQAFSKHSYGATYVLTTSLSSVQIYIYSICINMRVMLTVYSKWMAIILIDVLQRGALIVSLQCYFCIRVHKLLLRVCVMFG